MRRKKTPTPPACQSFERLVAGLHASDPRATVTWNDSIDGRQFDVTIRFPFQDYTYLTVIECKDQRVTPGDVDDIINNPQAGTRDRECRDWMRRHQGRTRDPYEHHAEEIRVRGVHAVT